MSNDRNYEVGRGKPPKHAQFKPGHSGNPKGRPKKAAQQEKDLFDLVLERLDQPIDLMFGGRQVRMPAKEAVAHQIVSRAVKGDFKALHLLERLIDRTHLKTATRIQLDRPGHDDDLSESDEAVIERFLQRQEKKTTDGDGDDDLDDDGSLVQ